MDRREFVKHSGAALFSSYLFGACNNFDEEIKLVLPECTNMPSVQSDNSYSPYRIIMNNDGMDAFGKRIVSKYSDINQFIEERTSPLMESSHVDAIFYCTGTTHLFSHKTKIGENIENDFLKTLYRNGSDPLKIIIDNVRDHDRDLFFSLRMNDTHDSTDKDFFPEWKKSNPDYLMGKENLIYPYGGNRWSAMNYGYPEVRNYIYSIIEEVLNNYEISGIELDFFRHPVFFRGQMFGNGANLEQIGLMSELIEKISKIVHEKNLKLAIRVPDSLSACYNIGLDLNTWLCNQWVDITTLSGYFHLEPWSNIKLLKEVFNSQFYACLSRSRLKYFDNMTLPDEYWRGESILAIEAGADGIYTFNMTDPQDNLFYELGDIDLIRSKPNNLRESEGFFHNYWIKNCSKFSTL